MARKKNMITRTVIGTEVTVLAIDVQSAEPQNKTYVLSGSFKDETKLLNAVKRIYDTDTLKNVSVVSAHGLNQLYGMYESDFVEHAMKLDENRKPITEVEQ